MKLCFPVEAENGLESKVYGHFGSAPIFVLFNTKTNTIETINNKDLNHKHGMCSPIKALDGKIVDAIVVGGIGAGAINKLNSMGIKVYRASKSMVKNNIDEFNNNSLQEITSDQACKQHGGCAH